MRHAVVELLKELYALRQKGGVTDAEARWVLRLVLPEYGLTVEGLAGVLQRARGESAA